MKKGVWINSSIDRYQLTEFLLTEENIELFNDKEFSHSNKRIEQFFEKFAASIFFKSVENPNEKMKKANLSVRDIREADEDDFKDKDANVRRLKSKELKKLIKLIMEKIGKVKLHSLIEKLADKGYVTIYDTSKEQKKKKLTRTDDKYIFSVNLLNRAKKINFLTKHFLNEKRRNQLLEETYDKPKITNKEIEDMREKIKTNYLKNKKIKNLKEHRNGLSKEKRMNFDAEFEEAIEQGLEDKLALLEEVDDESNYSVIDSFDKSKVIYIPEILKEKGIITVKLETSKSESGKETKSSLNIIIDTNKYFQKVFDKAGLDKNILDEKSKYNLSTRDDEDLKTKIDLYEKWINTTSQSNEKTKYLTTLLDGEENEKKKFAKAKEIFETSDAKTKWILMLLSDLSEGGSAFVERISEPKDSEGNEQKFAISVLKEILDIIDNVYKEKTKDTDQDEEEDIEKQLLKSVLKTITFLKREPNWKNKNKNFSNKKFTPKDTDFSGFKDFFEPSFTNGILVLERIFSDEKTTRTMLERHFKGQSKDPNNPFLDQKDNRNPIETPVVEMYNVFSSLKPETGGNYMGLSEQQAYDTVKQFYNEITDEARATKLIEKIIASDTRISSTAMYDIGAAIKAVLTPQKGEVMMGKYTFKLKFADGKAKEALQSKENFNEFLNYNKKYGTQLADEDTGTRPKGTSSDSRLLYNTPDTFHKDVDRIHNLIVDDIMPFQQKLHTLLQKDSYNFTKGSPRKLEKVTNKGNWDDAAFYLTTSIFNTSGKGENSGNPETRIRWAIDATYNDFKKINDLMNRLKIETKDGKTITSQNIKKLTNSGKQEDVDNLFRLYGKYLVGLSNLRVGFDSDEMDGMLTEEVTEEVTESAKEIFDKFKESEAYKWFTSEDNKKILLSYGSLQKEEREKREWVDQEETVETDIFPTWFEDGYQGYYKSILRGNFAYDNVDIITLNNIIEEITQTYEDQKGNVSKSEILRKKQLNKITKMFSLTIEEIEEVDEINSLFFWLSKTDREQLVSLFGNFLITLKEQTDEKGTKTKRVDKLDFKSFKNLLNLGSLLRENRAGQNSYNMFNITKTLQQLFVEEILPNKRKIPKLEIKNKDSKLMTTLPRGMLAGLGQLKYIPFVSFDSKTSESLKSLNPSSAMSGSKTDEPIRGFSASTRLGSSIPSKVGSKETSMNDNARILAAQYKYKQLMGLN